MPVRPGTSYSITGRAGRLDDLLEVVEDAGLAGLVVVRRDEQQRVGAELLGLLGELDAVGGGVGADAGDDRGPVADRVLDRAQDLAVLGARVRGRALPRRAADHDAVVAVVDEVRRRSRAVPSRSTEPSSVNAVAIAVSIRPKGAGDVMGLRLLGAGPAQAYRRPSSTPGHVDARRRRGAGGRRMASVGHGVPGCRPP